MVDINRCTIVIALAKARAAVKHDLWARGEKPHYVAMSEITRMAKDYLLQNPDLIAEAKVVAEEIYQQHQAKLARQRWQRQMRRSISSTITNTPASPSPMKSKEFADA
jgi:hypothetical protein